MGKSIYFTDGELFELAYFLDGYSIDDPGRQKDIDSAFYKTALALRHPWAIAKRDAGKNASNPIQRCSVRPTDG